MRPGRVPAALLPMLAVSACVSRAVTATPTAIRDRAVELSHSGKASVEVMEGGTHEVKGDELVEVEMEGTTTKRWLGLVKEHHRGETRQLTVGQLVAGCPGTATAADPPCLVDHLIGAPIEVGKRSEFDGGAAARLAGSVMIVGVVSGCAIACDDPPVTIGAAAVGVALLLILQPLSVFR